MSRLFFWGILLSVCRNTTIDVKLKNKYDIDIVRIYLDICNKIEYVHCILMEPQVQHTGPEKEAI